MSKNVLTSKSQLISLHDPPRNLVAEITLLDYTQNCMTEGVVGGQTVTAKNITLALNSI
jgi:hypothetical protein